MMSQPEDIESLFKRIQALPKPKVDRFVVHCEQEIEVLRCMLDPSRREPTFHPYGITALNYPVYQDLEVPRGVLRAMLGDEVVVDRHIGSLCESDLVEFSRALREFGRALVDGPVSRTGKVIAWVLRKLNR